MSAGTYDFEIEQNASFRRKFRYEGPSGNPIDLSGATVRLQARRKYDSPTTLLDLTDGHGLTVTPLTGEILVELTKQQAGLLKFNRAVYDLFAEYPNGQDADRILKGIITGSRAVTHE